MSVARDVASQELTGGSASWGLSPLWRLRPNYDAAVLYRFDPEEIRYRLLALDEAILIAALSNSATVEAAMQLFCELVGAQEPDAQQLWTKILANPFYSAEDVLIPLSSGTRYTRVDLAQFASRFTGASPEPPLGYGKLEAPLSLLLMPTHRCVRNCAYCYAERPIVNRVDRMPTTRWLEVIDEAGQNGIDNVSFSGGDPMTHPDIFPIVERICAWGMTFVLATKKLLTQSDTERLASFGPEHGQFQVSIDSVEPTVIDDLLRSRDALPQLLITLQNLLYAGLDVRVNAVVTPRNLPGVDELVRAMHAMGVRVMNVTNYHRSFYRHNDSYFLSPADVRALHDTIRTLKDELEWPQLRCNARSIDYSASMVVGDRIDSWGKRATCSAGRSQMAITANGSAILCEQVPVDAPFVVGNLKKHSLMEVWRSPAWDRIVGPDPEEFRGTPCSECVQLNDCLYGRGYCVRDSFFVFGNPFHPPPNCPKSPPGWRMA